MDQPTTTQTLNELFEEAPTSIYTQQLAEVPDEHIQAVIEKVKRRGRNFNMFSIDQIKLFSLFCAEELWMRDYARSHTSVED